MGDFYHDPLHAQIISNVNNVANLNCTGFIFNTASSDMCLKPNYKYELYNTINTKVNAAKDHGKKLPKVAPTLVGHLLRNRLL